MLEEGYLTYGFSDFAEKDYISRVRAEGGRDYMENRMMEEWGVLTTNRYQLWRFISEMKSGDWVLVPSYKEFSIYELLEDEPLLVKDIRDVVIKDWTGQVVHREEDGTLLDDKGEVIDLGFARRVKEVVTGISRDDYADSALTSRLKVRQTNVNIDGLKESVIRAKECAEKNSPINLKASVMDEFVPKVQEKIVNDLDADKFEQLVKWYFERIGCDATIMPKNPSDKIGEEDVDVMATFESLKLIVYVQVKHHEGKTGDWAAEQIRQVQDKYSGKESMDDGYNRVYWVISSADYSEECVNLAKENKIQLINGKTFAEMLIDAGLLNLPL